VLSPSCGWGCALEKVQHSSHAAAGLFLPRAGRESLYGWRLCHTPLRAAQPARRFAAPVSISTALEGCEFA